MSIVRIAQGHGPRAIIEPGDLAVDLPVVEILQDLEVAHDRGSLPRRCLAVARGGVYILTGGNASDLGFGGSSMARISRIGRSSAESQYFSPSNFLRR